MKNLFLNKLLFLTYFFFYSMSALAQLCNLPIDSCLGAGCSFRKCVSMSRSFPISAIPLSIPNPAEVCATNGLIFSGVSNLPIKNSSDLRSRDSRLFSQMTYFNGAAGCPINLALSSETAGIPRTINVTFQGWEQVTPPDCANGIPPGGTWTSYSTATGSPNCPSPITSICSSSGNGLYDIPPAPFATCSNLTPKSGVCGTAHNSAAALAPSGATLCSEGPVFGLSGSGPWAWTCQGQDSGPDVSCSTAATVTGCWSMDESWTSGWNKSTGSPSNTGSCSPIGSWKSGGKFKNLNTGFYEYVSESIATRHSECRPASEGRCNSSGGIPGVCGSAHNTSVATAPTGAALCTIGNVASFSGAGPWTWNCQGENSGPDSTCNTVTSNTYTWSNPSFIGFWWDEKGGFEQRASSYGPCPAGYICSPQARYSCDGSCSTVGEKMLKTESANYSPGPGIVRPRWTQFQVGYHCTCQ